MKKILFLYVLALPMMGLAQEKSKKNTKIIFEVSGNCEMCKARIEKSALNTKGVKSANWDIPSNLISVIYNSKKVQTETVQKAIARVGHDTPLIKATDSIYGDLPMCCLYRTVANH
jgi:copper chaperone CopZ